MKQDVRECLAHICYGVAIAIGGALVVAIGAANQPDEPFESSRGADIVQMLGGCAIFVAVVLVVVSLIRIGRVLSNQSSDDLTG